MEEMDATRYSTSEAAAQLGVSPSTLRRYLKEGFLTEPGWGRVGRRRQREYDETWIQAAKAQLRKAS